MKARRRIKRALRMLALSGCVSALALPAAAVAQPVHYPTGPSATPSAHHPHGRPAAFAGSTITAGTGQQADARRQPAAYSLPAGFASDIQSGGVPTGSAQTPSVVVREVRTITQGSDHTLALVLASAALAIALCGSAFAVVRTARIQRGVLGSNS